MAAPENNTRKIIARLEREGWVNVGGKKHTKFKHPTKRGAIQVPRHATVTPLVNEGTNAVTTYVALIDGKPGAFGVVFPDCPGRTAMGRTVEEAVENAAEALAEWADDVGPMPKPRTVAQLRRDSEIRQALADGDAVLAFVSLARPSVRHVERPAMRRRYA